MSNDKQHALLSPSSAHRWLTCTKSIQLEQSYPDTTSSFAEEGTLAHEIASIKLALQFFKAPTINAKDLKAKLKQLTLHEHYSKEMEGHTDDYVNFVGSFVYASKEAPAIFIEERVDYSAYAPEGFGTADCILIGADEIHIIDFKYGKGVKVDADDNDQLKIYALGAMDNFGFLCDVKTVKLSIFQPRIDNISTCEMERATLLAWADEQVKPKARLAYNGEGEYQPSEKACKFCKAKGDCKARAEHFEKAYKALMQQSTDTMTTEEKADVLKRFEGLPKYLKDLEASLLNDLLNGAQCDDFKVVESTTRARITDEQEAVKRLINYGVQEPTLYRRTLISQTDIKKLIGASAFNDLINPLLERPRGEPKLVPMADKRKPYEYTPDVKQIFS